MTTSRLPAQTSIASMNVSRFTPTFRQHAITGQDLDNSLKNNMAAKAQLHAQKRKLERTKPS